MKKYNLLLTLFWVGILLHLTSNDSYSSFLIGFNSGRRIYVENYRIEGEEIFLYLKSGFLKVSRGDVKSISEEKDVPSEDEKEEIAAPKKEAKEVPGTSKGNTSGTPSTGKNDDIERYRKKKAEISEKLEKAKKNYFEASDRSDKESARKIMISISQELFAIEEEVIKGNGGTVPDWWKQ